MQKLTLAIGGKEGHDIIKDITPDNIISILTANKDVNTVALVQCSCQQLLDFMLEAQKQAVNTHLLNTTDKREVL